MKSDEAKEPGQVDVDKLLHVAWDAWGNGAEGMRRVVVAVLEAAGVERLREQARVVAEASRRHFDEATENLKRAEQAEKELHHRLSELTTLKNHNAILTTDIEGWKQQNEILLKANSVANVEVEVLREKIETLCAAIDVTKDSAVARGLAATEEATKNWPEWKRTAGDNEPTIGIPDPGTVVWRVGRTSGRTLYRDERSVGRCDTAEAAREVCDTMNFMNELIERLRKR